jgi:hypothetical protein
VVFGLLLAGMGEEAVRVDESLDPGGKVGGCRDGTIVVPGVEIEADRDVDDGYEELSMLLEGDVVVEALVLEYIDPVPVVPNVAAVVGGENPALEAGVEAGIETGGTLLWPFGRVVLDLALFCCCVLVSVFTFNLPCSNTSILCFAL